MPELPDDKNSLRELLEEEIQKTRRLIATYRDMNKPVAPDVAIGRISRMDAINNKSVTEAALRKAKDKLAKLKIAHSKVNEEDFGLCVKCKQPIPLGRILIMPQTRSCVKCSH